MPKGATFELERFLVSPALDTQGAKPHGTKHLQIGIAVRIDGQRMKDAHMTISFEIDGDVDAAPKAYAHLVLHDLFLALNEYLPKSLE